MPEEDTPRPDQGANGPAEGPWTFSHVRNEFEDGSCSRQVAITHEDSFKATLSVGGASIKHSPVLELRSDEMHTRVTLSISMPHLVLLMREAGYKVKIPCSDGRGRILIKAREDWVLPPWMLEELRSVKWPDTDGERAICHECGRLTAIRRDGTLHRHYRCGQQCQGLCPGTKRLPRG